MTDDIMVGVSLSMFGLVVLWAFWPLFGFGKWKAVSSQELVFSPSSPSSYTVHGWMADEEPKPLVNFDDDGESFPLTYGPRVPQTSSEAELIAKIGNVPYSPSFYREAHKGRWR
jgi:hypothetical protein